MSGKGDRNRSDPKAYRNAGYWKKTCDHDILNPERKGRACYYCRKCGADVSMDVILLAMAELDEPSLCRDCGRDQSGTGEPCGKCAH